MARPKKDEFADLPGEFVDNVVSLSNDDVKLRISQIAMNQVELMRLKDDDKDLEEKQTLAKEAGAVYRDGTKMNNLKIKYLKRMLEDRGVATVVEN